MAELTVEQAVKVHEWVGFHWIERREDGAWWADRPGTNEEELVKIADSDEEFIANAKYILSQSEEVMGRVYDFLMSNKMWDKSEFLELQGTEKTIQLQRALSLDMPVHQMMGVEG